MGAPKLTPIARSISALLIANCVSSPAFALLAPVWIDVNQLRMDVSPAGTFSYDWQTNSAGLEFPKGSGKTLMFAAGLWVSANGTQVSVTDYDDEFLPGSIVGGVADDPTRPEYKVYKLEGGYPSTGARDSALADYDAGAVPHGAPAVAALPNDELGILGDQMLWHVYNDANPASHTSLHGGTAPLGIEVQQTLFAFNRVGALGNTLFMRFKLIDKGSHSLADTRLGLWLDTDDGGFADDLVGCDTSRALAYCYNGTNADAMYGTSPPAIGFDLLAGPLVSFARQRPSAFLKYMNPTDPVSAAQSIWNIHGFNVDGSPIIDPTTSQQTHFMVPGDPVGGTGWLDSFPADRRMMLCAGPCNMAPGDTQDIVVAIIVARGTDRLDSITLLRNYDDAIQGLFDGGFVTTAADVALENTTLSPDAVRLVWHSADRAAVATVYRSEAGAPWSDVGTISADGTGRMDFDDSNVRPGVRYGYRLGIHDGSSERIAGEVWVTVPTALRLALAGLTPNPSSRRPRIAFTLPSGEAATLELFDVRGRRIAAIDVGALGAGAHDIALGPEANLVPGVYFMRLRQSGHVVTARGAIIR